MFAAAASGCPTPLRCAVVATRVLLGDGGEERVHSARCVAEGLAAAGEACKGVVVDAGQGGAAVTDNCGARLTCALDDGCRRLCQSDGAGCPTHYTCVQFFPQPEGPSLAGSCVPTCDAVTQKLDYNGLLGCGLGRACYGFTGPASFDFICAQEGMVSHGAVPALAFLNSCAGGAQLYSYNGTNYCLSTCRPAETHRTNTGDAGGVAPYTCAARGAPNADCRFWWFMTGADGGARANDWGLCVDPGFLVDSQPCASLDAGDHAAAGCAPLP